MRSGFLLVAAIFAAGACGALAAETPSKDDQAIRALQARLAAAVGALDLDAVMREYAPGNELFVFNSDLPRQHIGWDSYKEDWWGFIGTSSEIKVEVEDLGVTVGGNLAFSHSLEHLTWTRKKDGSQGEMLMSITDGYRKIGGKWLIVMEHWSIPVVDGKGVLMAKP